MTYAEELKTITAIQTESALCAAKAKGLDDLAKALMQEYATSFIQKAGIVKGDWFTFGNNEEYEFREVCPAGIKANPIGSRGRAIKTSSYFNYRLSKDMEKIEKQP
jgi:hypothetical protein